MLTSLFRSVAGTYQVAGQVTCGFGQTIENLVVGRQYLLTYSARPQFIRRRSGVNFAASIGSVRARAFGDATVNTTSFFTSFEVPFTATDRSMQLEFQVIPVVGGQGGTAAFDIDNIAINARPEGWQPFLGFINGGFDDSTSSVAPWHINGFLATPNDADTPNNVM